MIKTKKYAIVLLFVSLQSVHTAHSASYFGKTFQLLQKGAYWMLTLSTPSAIFYDLHVKRKEITENTYAEATFEHPYQEYSAPEFMARAYAHQELKKLGLPNSHVYPYILSCAGARNILIETTLMDSLKKALVTLNKPTSEVNQQEKVEAQKAVNKFKGILHHEAQHVLNGDITYRIIAASIAGAVAPISIRAGSQLILKSTSLIAKTLKKRTATQGLLNGVINTQIFNKANRIIEQQADDGIKDNEAMKGLVSFLSKKDKEIQDLKKQGAPIGWNAMLLENYATHPSPASRIKKLESRLQ